MQKFFGFFVAGALMMSALPAVADTFIYKDQKNGYQISFPDTWRVQTPETPNGRIRVAGPLAEDFPTCSMKADHDGRIQIYDKKYVDEAIVHILDMDFWRGEIGENGRITEYISPASMGGKGDATAIKAVWQQDAPGGGKMAMSGAMIGSIYGDKKFIISCSSRAEAYEKWVPIFASIMDSVELDSRYHPFRIGYYRDFLADPKLALPRIKPGTTNKNTFIFGNYN